MRPAELSIPEGVEERFWPKVDTGDENECWEWQASTGESGYGRISIGGKPRQAHRVAYMLSEGEIDGELVLHHCDNKFCVNPAHLYAGTYGDNLNDAYDRGQMESVQELTQEEVQEIRDRDDEPAPELADEYEVSRSHIWNIWAGRRG